MQSYVLPEFKDIVWLKSRKVPGKYETVAKAAGISRMTLSRKMKTGEFTISELKGMNTVLHFTRTEKEMIWN